ncbi:E3 ubiquitin ligase Rnf121-like isoform X1 [Watersipora subatra]|uniref:E3 ubiquitin ligase Rnf121-like isoform X1 n=2 Tax=Watersipora subatra TaxID=2589382 RepID=UPI00355AE84F
MADLDHPSIISEGKVLVTPDLSKMSPAERQRYEHQLLHEKHKGHEAMHAEMMMILMISLIVAQAVLLIWRTKHNRSYQSATLCAMWLVPLVICVRMWWMKFVIIWCLYSLITGNVCYKALQKPITMTTPRWVYKWFLLVYKFCYGLGIAGYFCILFTFLGFNVLLGIKPDSAMNFGLQILFYGLYFGVVSRDFSETCTEMMASSIGYYTPSGLPGRQLDENVCAVCGCEINYNNETAVIEKRYSLTCGHTFHEFCIRGWYIVGKKQTCPYCKEKVDLKRLFASSPWEQTHIYYNSYLDFVRFLVAWLPIIFTIVQGFNWMLGLE